MRKFRSLTGLLAAVIASSGVALQVQAAGEAPKAVPVEMYTCSWREGKDMSDLKGVNERFNKYMDANETGYSAWTITPQFRALEDAFDIGWIGAWADGASMGATLDNRMGPGSEILASYNEVLDCENGHVLMSSVPVNAPDGPPGDGVVMFSSCTVDDDSTMAEAYQAHAKVGADMIKRGSKASSFLFHPGLGLGETDFDYYMVIGFENYVDLGNAFDIVTSSEARAVRHKHYDGVVECDSPRAYDAKVVRQAPAS